MNNAAYFDQLAALFSYPTATYLQHAEQTARLFSPLKGEIVTLLEEFNRQVQSLSLEKIQELFTATFDLNPVASLEIGWHLHGENYERGRFMVEMREQLRRLGVEEKTELPDHLTHVLPMAGRMPYREVPLFLDSSVLPGLAKIQAALKEKDNLFEPLLRATEVFLNHYSKTSKELHNITECV
ncbi:MAG: nitrate reductase molybdenum cofactor assembly chaperone [Acidobacteria bacterium]|nr:nitrate reductase molybdenum cofactor assembly chaperone [Acidobacteriota bacterium]